MSKIIYLTPPAHGHVNPTLAVVQELARRGEQILYYNTADFRPQIEQTGALFRAYPDTDMTATNIAQLLQHGHLVDMTGLILRTTEQLLPFILDELAREKPDLVIFDSIALWGKMATNQLQLRAAASIGLFVMDDRQMKPLDLLRMVGQVLPRLPGLLVARRRLIQRYGKAFPAAQPLFPMRGGLNIVYTARELQPDTPIIDTTFRFVGPSINPQQRSLDVLGESLGPEPLVYISLGTVRATNTAFFRTCLAAFAEYPARFIMSVGTQTDMNKLGPIPANFIVRPSVPQLEVLQQTDVFMTHAGMNSVHEGLYYGVPLVLIPHQFEQLLNARCVAARGAGYIIDNQILNKPISAAVLRQALNLVQSKPSYRESARQIQRSLQATGGYRQAADEIQAYVAAGTAT